VKSAPEKVAAKLFILQGGAEPLSSVPVWAEPSQLLHGNWLFDEFPVSDNPVYQDLTKSLENDMAIKTSEIAIKRPPIILGTHHIASSDGLSSG
jgi:hypothetical protein